MKVTDFQRKKNLQEKIVMLTCYDYPSARTVAESTVDCLLVGDSVAMAVHGHDNTLLATMEMMIMHTAAVARGAGPQFIISDLPFLCTRQSQAITVDNVRCLLQAGAHAVKIEGGDADTCQTIQYLVASGVPVFGHIGLTPQSLHQLGGYKVQGKNEAQAAALLQQAEALEKAGCTALVLECIPQTLAKKITQTLTIPTFGIGAGAATDGQVLVWHDMLGLQDDFKPRFLKQYAEGKAFLLQAINAYAQQVKAVQFPSPEYEF